VVRQPPEPEPEREQALELVRAPVAAEPVERIPPGPAPAPAVQALAARRVPAVLVARVARAQAAPVVAAV
jgi:hypothetical protein